MVHVDDRGMATRRFAGGARDDLTERRGILGDWRCRFCRSNAASFSVVDRDILQRSVVELALCSWMGSSRGGAYGWR
jgi:hypothetical protein